MSNEETQIDGVVYYPTKFDENGIPLVQAPLTESSDKRPKNILAPSPYVIPVLFVPGIMGTNLRTSGGDGKVVWRPPNMDMRGIGEVLVALTSYLFKDAGDRKRELAKDAVEIDLGGPIDTAGTGLPEDVLRERGWGGIMRSCYHPTMGKIQTMLSPLMMMGKLGEWAATHGQDEPGEWGECTGLPKLDQNEFRHAARYRFEVWGAGYNWLASNRDSGRNIRTLIEKTILPWYKKHKLRADKVIVVTHSMGGLVSRSLTEIHGCDSVLGVVHGVMPATGAPATYKRMRAGFEGPAQVILGRDAAEVTAVLSGAPGGLELLPAGDYNDGKPWLFVRDKQGGNETLSLPEPGGNPYDDIYSATEWFGLVPEANEGLMEPGTTSENASNIGTSPRLKFKQTIEGIADFHKDVAGNYFKPSYVHYGHQGKKQGGLFGGNRYTWGEVVWQTEGPLRQEDIAVAEDNGNGQLTLANGMKLKVADPDCPGDGTVPCYSGAAPGTAGVAGFFRHGQSEDKSAAPQKHNHDFGYDHQESYNDERALYATLYGIVKIAQKANWHE